MMVIASQLTGPIAAMSSSVVSRMRGAVATNSFSKNHVGARLKNPVTNMNRIMSPKATIPGEPCATVVGHERLINGGGDKTDNDRENVADGDQGQFLRIAHVSLPAAKIAIRSQAVMEMISAQISYGAPFSTRGVNDCLRRAP
jgi:hypothetical protein